MQILIDNSALSTNIFILILTLIVIFGFRPKEDRHLNLSSGISQELKGFAILAVVFSHIGLFLSKDPNFLYPLTIVAGVGVNIFLFLSGYGLVASALKKELKPWQFYRHRLSKLYLPMWLCLIFFFTLDYLFLQKIYGVDYIVKSFLGFFPRADLFHDVNSPLWYFTLIVFYYLLFPLVFMKKRPWLSALIVYLVSDAILDFDPDSIAEVVRLYQVHLISFPLGMALSGWLNKEQTVSNFRSKLHSLIAKPAARYLVMLAAASLFAYTAYNSGVGESPRTEEFTSLISVSAAMLFFIFNPLKNRLFSLFGFYSYEIYLLHWPILARYDLFYASFPGWLATFLYLTLFIILSYLLQKLVFRLSARARI